MNFKYPKTFAALAATGVIAAIGLVTAPSEVPTSAAPALSSPAPSSTKGIGVYYLANVTAPTPAWQQQHAVATATFLKSLGANTAMVTVPFFTSGATSNTVFTGVDPSNTSLRTPTTTEVGTVITALQNAGLQVDVRPLLDEGDLQPLNWRGSITPTNRAAWFASYESTIQPYLQMSQLLGVKSFTVESELQSLNSDPHWTSLISWAQSQYTGQLVWNPDLLGYTPGVIARQGTSTSLDLYPGVPAPDNATVAQLVAGWNSWWASTPRTTVPMQITIAEVHILAQDGVYATPWYHSAPGAFDQNVQANWFSAACQFSRQHHFGGIMYWTLNFLLPLPSLTVPDPTYPTGFQPQSLAAIKSCFAG